MNLKFNVGDLSTAGLMQLTPDMLNGGMRPGWVGFIGVDDVDLYAKRLEQAGLRSRLARGVRTHSGPGSPRA